jgi:hypothetical protein
MDYIQGCLLLFLINSSICIEDDQESKKDGAPYCDPFLSHVNNRVHDYVIYDHYLKAWIYWLIDQIIEVITDI